MGRTSRERGERDVVQIGGGAFGPLITDRWDCNMYVVRGRDRAVVIDAGAGRSSIPVPADADTLLLTHLHLDHSGGAQRLAALGVTVLGHSLTADGLARGDEVRAGLAQSKTRGFYPPDFVLEPCP